MVTPLRRLTARNSSSNEACRMLDVRAHVDDGIRRQPDFLITPSHLDADTPLLRRTWPYGIAHALQVSHEASFRLCSSRWPSDLIGF